MPYSYFEKKGRRMHGLLCLSFLLVSVQVAAQVRWDGEGGDGQWGTAANWSGNAVPAATDNVLLDNSRASGNYTVSLPAAAGITVNSLRITPAPGDTIQLVIPAASTVTPAITVTGGSYGIILNNGGVLLNESGANSSATISVLDSLRINNGGKYVHRTRSAHAALVTLLSKQPGTETGIFMFDVPGGGYTIASTNRTYGTLVLSSQASGGVQAYASTAVNPFTINGNLVIESGVSFNLNLTGATVIKGNFIQDGGLFNLASQDNNNTVSIKGNCLQSGGSITETANGLPVFQFDGTVRQNVQLTSITNSVAVTVNNPAGINLLSDASFPYQLNLLDGTISNPSFLITLQAGCSLQSDSLPNNRFINGGLKKEGLSSADHFLFPIGKGNTKRWVALKNSTGSFTAEFFKMNPKSIATSLNGIDHTSSIEYWSVKADAAPVNAAKVELSFDDVNSGGVTDMASLRVAQLLAGSWAEAGNTATTGSAGGAGSVVSKDLLAFNSVDYFTLASSTGLQNPLPVELVSMKVVSRTDAVLINWECTPSFQPAYFLLQSSPNDSNYTTLARVDAGNRLVYAYTDSRSLSGNQYYYLQAVDPGGSIVFSKKINLLVNPVRNYAASLTPTLVKSKARLMLDMRYAGTAQLAIYTIHGKCIQTFAAPVRTGNNTISLQLQGLADGLYVLMVARTGHPPVSIPFVKLP